METPRLYLIVGVDLAIADPMGSSLVLDEDVPEGRCPSCRDFSPVAPHPIIIQGFDDMIRFREKVPAFLSPAPSLVAARAHAQRLAKILTGVEYVDVGYRSWNQGEDLPEQDRFIIPPLLGGLYVTAMSRDFRWEDGTQIRRCDVCNHARGFAHLVREKLQDLRVSRKGWPGTDLFFLEGGSRKLTTFITQDGVNKLLALGFRNLRLCEAVWGD